MLVGISLNGVALALLAALLARYRELLRRGATLVPALAIATLALVACSGDDDAAATDLNGTVQVLSGADELLFHDAIGSLTEETSGAGAPRATFASYPFGVARFDTSGQTRKYANAPRDTGIGLDQMGARSYTPDLGVWTSADPVALHEPERGVGAAFAANNPYGYAGENPTIAADENGHWLHIVVGALVGGTISAGIEAYRQYSETGHIESYGRIGAKFSVGAAAGGLVAALPSPATIGGVVALGAGESVATGVADRMIDSGGKSAGSFKDAALDAAVGAATAGLMAGGGAIVRKIGDAIEGKTAPVVRRAARLTRPQGASPRGLAPWRQGPFASDPQRRARRVDGGLIHVASLIRPRTTADGDDSTGSARGLFWSDAQTKSGQTCRPLAINPHLAIPCKKTPSPLGGAPTKRPAPHCQAARIRNAASHVA